ncbi:MAG TPA: hypothetical protein VE961_19770 [Pyrinomonadaceae bacterium]|nr:hypothetical protein [Pyrinomonadaceae bacterium]
MKKRTRTRTKRRPVPAKQWDLPAGFHADGVTMATLKDVVDPGKPTKQLSDLPFEKRAELVLERLNQQPKIDLAMIGAGSIDKARAITEVRHHTKVGRLLIEIEHQMIRNLIEHAQKAGAGQSSGV